MPVAPDDTPEGSAPVGPAPLRELLRSRARALAGAAIRSGGQVGADELEALARLARLADICEPTEPVRPRPRWPTAAVLVLTLLVVSLLFFVRVRETDIALDVALAEVSFELPAVQVLVEGLALSALGASGLREIRLPAASGRDAQALGDPDGAESAVRLAATSEGSRQGTIHLAAITAPAKTRVWIRHLGAPNQYRLSLKGPDLSLQASLHGPVLVALAGAAAQRADFAIPRAVLLKTGPDVVDLDLTFAARPRDAFAQQIAAHGLSFFRVDQFSDTERALVRRLSTILSGTLYYESLAGVERRLRPGQEIRFGQSRGELRAIRLEEDRVALRFEGWVSGMTTGPDSAPTDLMPTWLEWLRARHGMALLWGTALYLFGFASTALRWLRVPV